MAKYESQYVLQSVSTALRILDLFIDHEELGATDVANMLGITRSAAYRNLVTLESEGYLRKQDNTKYRLDMKVISLGQTALQRNEIILKAKPFLQDMSHKCKETCLLAILKGDTQSEFIYKAVGSHMLKMDVAIGTSNFLHNSATGKSLLAHQSPEFINKYITKVDFKKITDKSIGSAKELLLQLEEIRNNRYSVDDEECDIGLTCYATPILSRSGHAVAAISCSGPTTRMEKKKESIIQMLWDTAEKIEQNGS